jgi:surfeit locus 1 family protein
MRLRKPPFWASFFTLLGFVLLCSLGTWQVHRLEWKNALITKLEEASRRSAVETLSFKEIEKLASAVRSQKDSSLVRYVFVEGQWLHDKEIAIGPRTWKGETGYHILTPLRMEDGILLINRGWVPQDKKQPEQRPESLRQQHARIMGMLRYPPVPNIFTPANQIEKNEWYQINLDEIAAARKLADLAPIVLYTHLDTAGISLPVAAALEWRPPNNHAQYAAFWFSMAAILLVIFALRFVATDNNEKN